MQFEQSFNSAEFESVDMTYSSTQLLTDLRSLCGSTLTKIYNADVQWVIGFLTGFAHFKDKDLLKNTDYDAVAAYVDQKCKLKPLALIFDAAAELGEDLAK